ncbi:gfo/Idh/MocA family oxidoreductase [Actinopolyspora erythraea]|uniref:Oxidoreductase n=1 Tax=Actinopolyspora erythraea TaxID=414996 RepID=A0A099D759_9ACTN|nr:Gfo/Idh/MocA family oxidoreductase [Actinopolyspora erythraea]ASU78864.1 gfo/Idh/MocA family oxidoreductase [Actinopolyspora erythraea]KGI81215.1 oxidoreductase [Actinopolyspora erythraea]
MSQKTLRIALNGVTGRMGYRQHLLRSVLELRDRGGLEIADGERVTVEPVLVGRNSAKLAEMAQRHSIDEWSTELDTVLSDDSVDVYFDAQITSARERGIRAAIAAGKHVYSEKPVAESSSQAVELARLAEQAGIRHGVVHDKLYLPGLLKLRRLIDGGFFGRVLSVRGEFGYWVFEGDWQSAQRPSWNYRAEDGGGIVSDMFCHWHYVLENLFGRVDSVTAKATTHIPTRWDERGEAYEATADDSAYGIFELADGVIAQINSSWAVRVNRDELVEFQVDGTEGSAVAGLRGCRVQHRSMTPKPVWNPDLPAGERFREQWSQVPDNEEFDNGFKAQWERFLHDVLRDGPHPYDFFAGARGIQLAEAGLRSSRTGQRVPLESLER